MFEMLDKANEMAQRTAYDTREWTVLRKQAILTGDGVMTAFDLPPDFKRMLLTANVWRSTDTMTPMCFISDTDEWLQRRATNSYEGRGEWTMLGGQMHIHPPLGVGVTARFPYLERNCVRSASGVLGDRFLADTDVYRLDERVLKLGMIFAWKQHKGSPYSEDMGTWGDAIAMAGGYDSPSPIIIGRLPASANARVAYPWPAPSGYIT